MNAAPGAAPQDAPGPDRLAPVRSDIHDPGRLPYVDFDTSIHAVTSDVERTSVYAGSDVADPARTVIAAINETDQPVSDAVTVAAHANDGSVDVRQLTDAGPDLAAGAPPALADTDAFVYDMPAYSVSVLVLRP